MTKITIIIPVDDYAGLEAYYRDVLSFTWREGLFFLPVGAPEVALKLLIVDYESKAYFPPKSVFQFFATNWKKISYPIAKKYTRMVL